LTKTLFEGEKNDFRDAEAIAEAVQRPTMKFVVRPAGYRNLPVSALVMATSTFRSRTVRRADGLSAVVRCANVPIGFEIDPVRLFGLRYFFGMSRALRTIRSGFIQFSRETRSISAKFFFLLQGLANCFQH